MDERRARGPREVAVLVVFWIAYTVVRATAGTDVHGAHESARSILALERTLHLDIEAAVNQWALGVRGVQVVASFMYASCHLAVTGAVLLWLYHRRPGAYRPLRTALVVATAIALACYLALPTAPPRFLPGYADIMQRTADVGWWPAGPSSVPTNELAAFPSMHAGWSLWVALALLVSARSLVPKVLGVAYALAVAAVIVLTANHWCSTSSPGGSWWACRRRGSCTAPRGLLRSCTSAHPTWSRSRSTTRHADTFSPRPRCARRRPPQQQDDQR